MKRLSRLFYIVLLVLLTLSGSVFAQTTVNLIATNDMHGVLEGSDTSIGIAQVSAIKNSTENALLIDSGDATQGTSLATINEGNDIIKLMNATGYDCMVAGNHEFDYGSTPLEKNAKTADFPILSANCVSTSGTLLPGTTVLTKAGKRIGFVGITTTITNTATNPALRPGVSFSNEITAAKSAIASLQGKVDTIVLLTHLGNDATAVPVTSQKLLDGLSDSELSQVSAVLDGHSHTIESEPYVRGSYKIPVIQDQTQLTHVGKVAITFNDNGSVSATEQVMDYDTANKYSLTSAGNTAKDNTLAAIDEVNNEQSKITSRVIGSTQTPLWGGYVYWDYAEPRIVETNFGDLVSDAYKDAAETYASQHGVSGEVLGMVNGGGIGNSINPGKITYGEILNIFNHGNMAVVIQTTPAELYKVLEDGLVTTGQDSNGMLMREKVSGSFIQGSGFTYSYNPAGASGSKITEVKTSDGNTLSRTDTTTPLIIGTQNYVQTFFGDAKQLSMLDGEDTTIADFISDNGNLNYPVNGNRITISDDNSPATYTVSIPVYTGSETTPAPANADYSLSIDNGNYQPYQTDGSSKIQVTLNKGPHTLILEGAKQPVYVNNYSGAGTSFTKAGYYSLSFVIGGDTSGAEMTVSTDAVDLSPQYGVNSQTVTATVTSSDTSIPIMWTTDDPQVATIEANGSSCQITGVNEGRTIVTASCGPLSKQITVIVSNSPIVATNFTVVNPSPDYFTVLAEDVHSNRAIPTTVDVAQVSMFAWSDENQSDINCKVVQQDPEVPGDYLLTFPINENHVNNYFLYPYDIKINIYASSEPGNNGNMIGAFNYNYANYHAMPTGLGVTAYCSNLGFIMPTYGNDAMAGAPDLSQPLEGIRIATPEEGVGIVYEVHVRDMGWLPSQYDGGYAGTMGLNKSIEAITIELTGENADKYTLTYQTVAQDGNTSDVCTSGQTAGTTGRALPLTGIHINLTPNS